MTDQTPSPNCPDCGTPLPDDSPHALCPSCLLRQALGSRTVADPDAPAPPATPPPTPDELADKFPGFEISECLGRGGMGVVYKARQKSLDRMVAIKILAPERVGEAKFAERFATEAQTLAKLSHPNIVTVFDYGETAGLYYIVMEFVDGVNLRDLLRDGKLDPKQALAIIPPICEALQFAHDKGIVHRDIKPENLLLDRHGRIKIADFGIASLVGAAGYPAGTPPYMAPEQGGTGPGVDHRADIYALGAVLYETLTGERPGDALNPPSQKVEIDIRIDDIVLRALNKEPGRRYRTADEFRTMVQTVAATQPPPPPSDHATTQPGNPAHAAAPAPATTGLADPRWTLIAAWAMITMGAINLVAPFGSFVLFMLWRAGAGSFGDAPGRFVDSIAGRFPLHGFALGGAEMVFIVAAIGISAAVGLVTLLGGRHLLKGTSRNWVIAGAIACCFSPVLWVIGVIVGIASIILVVSNKTGDPATHEPAGTPSSDAPRFSKLAITSAALHGLVAILVLLVAISIGGGSGMTPSVIAIGLPLLIFALPATVLAWVAAGQIRRSQGQLRGRRLAILSGMVLPSLFAIPVLAIGAGIIDATVDQNFRADDATNIILGTVTMTTFAAAALLGLRTCLRHLRGTPKNVLSKPVRITATTLLALWLAVGTLLWLQRPKTVGAVVRSQSPHGPYAVTASTLHRMHVFGPDPLTYHFTLVGNNGTLIHDWEILIPYQKLFANAEPESITHTYHFSPDGTIDWAENQGTITATFRVRDTTVHKITITPDGTVSAKTSD